MKGAHTLAGAHARGWPAPMAAARAWPLERWRRITEALALAFIIALAIEFNFYRLTDNSYGNYYYSAAVRSMSQNWHNFFFASFDAAGFISVDKPPLALWVQVASVKLLGYSSFSVLLPEALMGVCSVLLAWRLGRRAWGRVGGLVAALALVVSPSNVVVNRDNVMEPLLTLLSLLAVWAALRASERGKLGWLLVSAALIGLGFNTKMVEAYLVVPAVAVVYLLTAPVAWRRRFTQLAVAGALMFAISFAWIIAVDAVPASARPYVGSTTTNSEVELAISYNGVGRLFGSHGAIPTEHPHRNRNPTTAGAPTRSTGAQTNPAATRPPATPDPRSAPVPPSPTGEPGILRLLRPGLGSQIGWLLPLALGALLALWRWPAVRSTWSAWRPRGAWRVARALPAAFGRLAGNNRDGLLWGVWLLTDLICFSFARVINAYYVAVMGPAICVLAGAAIAGLWRLLRNQASGMTWLLAPALAITGVQQAYLLGADAAWYPGLGRRVATATISLAVAIAALALLRRRVSTPRASRTITTIAGGALALGLAATLVAPAGWSAASLTPGNAGGWPVAGPAYAHTGALPGRPLFDPKTLAYLEAHEGTTRYLVATVDAYLASPLTIATGDPIMMLGGFSGHDPAVTGAALVQMVTRGDVRYFLISSANVTPQQRAMLFPLLIRTKGHGFGGAYIPNSRIVTQPTRYTNALTQWVSAHCTPLPPVEWSSTNYAKARLGAFELYSCAASAQGSPRELHSATPSARPSRAPN